MERGFGSITCFRPFCLGRFMTSGPGGLLWRPVGGSIRGSWVLGVCKMWCSAAGFAPS